MNEEIHPMVTMLAERMRTNPEDFVWSANVSHSKFVGTAQAISELATGEQPNQFWFLSEAEKKILIDGLREIHRKQFNDQCLRRMLDDEEEHTGPASVKFKTQGRYAQTTLGWADPQAIFGASALQQRDNLRASTQGDTTKLVSLTEKVNGQLRKLVGK